VASDASLADTLDPSPRSSPQRHRSTV